MEDVQEVLSRQYTFIAKADIESGGWVIVFPDLPGVMTQADTYEEVATMAKDALETWVEAQIEDGRPIPEPSDFPLPEWDWNAAGSALITSKEAAQRLNVSTRRVLALAANRRIGKRFGRSVMFRENDIERLRPRRAGRPRGSRIKV